MIKKNFIFFLFFSNFIFSSSFSGTSSEIDSYFNDFTFKCGCREGLFKSFEIGRSGNVKCKSGLYKSYQIIKKGSNYFLNGDKYPNFEESFNGANIKLSETKTAVENNGILKLRHETKSLNDESYKEIKYFNLNVNEKSFEKGIEIYSEEKISSNWLGNSSGKCKKKA